MLSASFGQTSLMTALIFCSSLLTPAAEDAADSAEWGQFLGPRRDGISGDKGLNLDWTAKKPNEVWKAPVGAGFSSISCVGERLFTMVSRDKRDYAVCLDAANGKELWAIDLSPAYLDKQRQGPGPRATPTYHQGKLYCLHPMGDLFCLNANDGSEVWKVNIFEMSKAPNPSDKIFYWGLSASPLIEGDLVIVQPGGDKENAVLAVNKDSGKRVWSTGSEAGGYYGSPIAIDAAGRRMLVVAAADALLGLDAAKGDVLWSYAFGNRPKCNCATPLWVDGTLFYSAGYGAGAVALEIVKDGDKVAVKERWRNKNIGTHFATAIIHEGYIYGCNGDIGKSTLRCIDLKTGEMKWENTKPGKCSFVAAEGCLFCLNENGALRLIEMNPKEYVVKGEMENLLTYKCWSAPALAKRRLYVRDDKNLICLDIGKE
jgi:outer membrane protein assembly factor BamB